MKRILTAFVVVALIGAVPIIGFAKTECNGTITGTVNGGITVSDGDDCILNGATVNGGVKMSGGTLEACGSTLNGSVDATGGTCITLGLGPDDAPATCASDLINGHVSLQNVTGGSGCPGVANIEIEGSNINGGADLDNNGSIQLEGNTIQGSLDCEGNGSVTNEGITNTVTGQEKGQCAGL